MLVAEDNVINQKVTLAMLRRLGYRADLAANGLEAVESVRMIPYDVVFMDLQMPELDGLGAMRQIRSEHASGRRPRIVALTANAYDEDREACLAAGMDDYLSKPLQMDKLAAALERVGPAPPSARRCEHTVGWDGQCLARPFECAAHVDPELASWTPAGARLRNGPG